MSRYIHLYGTFILGVFPSRRSVIEPHHTRVWSSLASSINRTIQVCYIVEVILLVDFLIHYYVHLTHMVKFYLNGPVIKLWTYENWQVWTKQFDAHFAWRYSSQKFNMARTQSCYQTQIELIYIERGRYIRKCLSKESHHV